MALFGGLADGRRLPSDWSTSRMPAPDGYLGAVWGFPAHHVIAGAVPAGWLEERLPRPPRSPMTADFLAAYADALGGSPGELDLLLLSVRPAGPPTAAPDRPDLRPDPLRIHQRAARSVAHRAAVTVHRCPGGLATLGSGVGGRTEVSIEVDPEARGEGLGRRLAAAAHHLSGASAVWAQVSPGNTPSVRAFLAAGFGPIGSEVLIEHPAGHRGHDPV